MAFFIGNNYKKVLIMINYRIEAYYIL